MWLHETKARGRWQLTATLLKLSLCLRMWRHQRHSLLRRLRRLMTGGRRCNFFSLSFSSSCSKLLLPFFFLNVFTYKKKSKIYLDCICNIVLYTKIYIYPPDYIFFPLRYLHFIWRETNNLFKQYYFFTLWLPLTTQQFAVIVPHWNVRPAYQS